MTEWTQCACSARTSASCQVQELSNSSCAKGSCRLDAVPSLYLAWPDKIECIGHYNCVYHTTSILGVTFLEISFNISSLSYSFLPFMSTLTCSCDCRLNLFADEVQGLDQYAIRKFGEAFDVVPRTLAENSGGGYWIRFRLVWCSDDVRKKILSCVDKYFLCV